MEQALRHAVLEASRRAPVRAAVDEVYARVGAQVNARRPLCVLSGRCCRFEQFGHRLYVTTIELARFVYDLPQGVPTSQWDGTGCPFQKSKLCSVHAIRPFGCRMFFCDATSTDWQNAAYEQFHADLKRLHAELDVPYFYVEWRTALGMLGITPGVGAA